MTLRPVPHRANDPGLIVTLLPGRAGLCLSGEADLLGADVLRAAMAALPADIPEIHLDMAALRSIDVCCARELLSLAHRPPRPQLILHQPPASLTLLIRLLAPDCSQNPVQPGPGTPNGSAVVIRAAG
ncbi:MAG TPA: STAS domain-containing protein [Streptosporangiaceae bacterium]